MTASIIARDPVTGELGVGVFTAYPSAGMRVPFAEPGIGAVVSQAFAPRSIGPHMLELLRAGMSAGAVVEELIASDPAVATYQFAALAPDGLPAGVTGGDCVSYAEEQEGADCRCQANMMAGPGVPAAMNAAFEAAEGELATRLLEALHAGEAAGGDARGRTSAALLVVPARGEPWDATVDLRVDRSEDPLHELGRSLDLHRAYGLLDVAAQRARAGDSLGAMNAGMQALALAPDDAQLLLWLGLGAAEDNLEVGTGLVQRALELEPALAAFLERLPPSVMPAAPLVREALA